MVPSRLKSARLAAGLSQAALAKSAGLSQPFVAQVEGGDRAPSVETVQTLAQVLGVSAGYLFGQPDYAPGDAYSTNPHAAILEDPEAAPGLRDFARDTALVEALRIEPWEWQALRSLVMPVTPRKDGYACLLHVLRSIRPR